MYLQRSKMFKHVCLLQRLVAWSHWLNQGGRVRRKKQAGYRTIAAAEFIWMSRTIVYQQQSFWRTDVLWALVTFCSWHKVFLKPLGEDLRIHPGISLGLVDHGKRIHVNMLKDFPIRTGFSLWVPVAFVQPSTAKRSFAFLNPGADFSRQETRVLCGKHFHKSPVSSAL